jgi:transposase-like protein
MNNNTIDRNLVSNINIPKDIKGYVVKKIKEEGKSVKDIAKEYGVSKTSIYGWLKEEIGDNDYGQVHKLKKENQILKQLVAELSLKIREGEKRGW